MATKGTAAKATFGSASPDNEVEARIKALEEKAHVPCGGGSEEKIAALEAKVDDLIFKLSKKMSL